MIVFPALVSTTSELQRGTLEQGLQAAETGAGFQTSMGWSLVDGIERQTRAQRRMLALQHVAIHRVCNRIDEHTPGSNLATDAVREVVDEQFSQLYEMNDETFDTLEADLEHGVETCDGVSTELLDALSDQTELLLRAIEDAEVESLEAIEQLATQPATLVGQCEGRGQ